MTLRKSIDLYGAVNCFILFIWIKVEDRRLLLKMTIVIFKIVNSYLLSNNILINFRYSNDLSEVKDVLTLFINNITDFIMFMGESPCYRRFLLLS